MTFTFCFLSSRLISFFLQGLILVGKDFGKTLRIVGLEKKDVQEGSTYLTTFSSEFSGQLYMVFWVAVLPVWLKRAPSGMV